MYFPSTLALPISDSYPSSRSGALSLILYLKEDFKEHKAKSLPPNYQYMALFLCQLMAARWDLRQGIKLWICSVYVNLPPLIKGKFEDDVSRTLL
jgi:hypothetical protein